MDEEKSKKVDILLDMKLVQNIKELKREHVMID